MNQQLFMQFIITALLMKKND